MGEEKGGGLCHESVRLQEARVARVKLEEGGVLVAFPFLADPLNGENGSVPIENLAGERANVPGCQAPTRPDSGPEHSALSTQHSEGRTGGRTLSSLVSGLSALVSRQSSVSSLGRKEVADQLAPRKSMASLFLSFFFLVAIGLALRNKEREGGDRRGEADECCDGMRECFLWRRGTCRSWASLSCRLPPSRSRASSEASVLLFFLVEGGGAHGMETSVDSVEIRRVTSLPPLSAVERIRAGEWRCMNGTADAISAGGPRPPAPTSARAHQLAIIILLEN